MKKDIIGVFLGTFLFLIVNGYGQAKPDPYFEFYLIPQDMAVALKASRNGLPVEIEKVELFTNLTGSLVKCSYQFRNVGSKPIRGVEIAVIDRRFFHLIPAGMGERYTDLIDLRNTSKGGGDLAPGASIAIDQKLDRNRELPSDIVTRIKKQSSKVKTKFIVALVITGIEFADGTVLNLRTDADDIELLFTEGFEG